MIAALFLVLTSLSVGARTRMALPCASAPPADDGPVLLREGGVLLGSERADGPRLWFTDSPLDEPGTLLHSDGTAESTVSIPLPGAARWTLGRAGGRFVFSVADPGGETVRATDGITEDLEVLATVSETSTTGVPLNDALYFLGVAYGRLDQHDKAIRFLTEFEKVHDVAERNQKNEHAPGSTADFLLIDAHAAFRCSIGHITDSMPRRQTPRKMNGATDDGRSIPAASPQAATAPPYLVIDRTFESVVDPTLSIPPAHRSFASGLAGPDNSLRSITSAAPMSLR